MSRRGVRRRGSVKRPSNAVGAYSDGNTSTTNTTDYTHNLATGADAPDRGYVLFVAQRGNANVDPDGVTLGGNAMAKLGASGANNINFSTWWLPGGVYPTGSTASVVVDNPTTTGARTMCNVELFRVTGQTDTVPTWFNPVLNGGAGTGLDMSPPTSATDGVTFAGAAAPGSNASFTWAGVTEAYDGATESSDCRVSGGAAAGLPAALTATTSASVTNLMGAAVHIR